MNAVYPHIRGAYRRSRISFWYCFGSSPHTWGIQLFFRVQCANPRFIPTYVGHTVLSEKQRKILAVHPHIRGAYNFFNFSGNLLRGSSPHTWGILQDAFSWSIFLRFIPTYVGHTSINARLPITFPVHPHIRGAYVIRRRPVRLRHGSSPHTWGIQTKDKDEKKAKRFIPTYVGHTAAFICRNVFSAVHPHIRGAYVGSATCRHSFVGSSPHTWGIPFIGFIFIG